MTTVIFEIDARSGPGLLIKSHMLGERENTSKVEEAIARSIITAVALGMSENASETEIRSFSDGTPDGVKESQKISEAIRTGLEKGANDGR